MLVLSSSLICSASTLIKLIPVLLSEHTYTALYSLSLTLTLISAVLSVYFFDVNAQAKLFIDRLYSYFQFPFVETYGTKKFAMIVSQGMEDPELFKGTLNKQVEAFGFLGFDVQGLTVVPDNNIPDSAAYCNEAHSAHWICRFPCQMHWLQPSHGFCHK